ncbi:hybrid sensor histidine kinase/response regulator [Symmachiella dynata]|uniref:hybrid sensor histidine kinase/response regulator n=1 Tax=Symmachiella dynata TaxID=2527995 RepID=UPI00119F6791|nr:hybrid sensor histidine kinase/response regulator [Symmachiella dynata]
MSSTKQDTQFAWRAMCIFLALGGWICLLKSIERFGLISAMNVSLLRLISSVVCFAWLAKNSLNRRISTAIRATFLVFVVSITLEMFFGVTEDVAAWKEVAIVGQNSETRRLFEQILSGLWFGSGLFLVYLMVRSLEQTTRKLEATVVELHESQEQNIRRERLSALGEMASGVAHDLNNTLAPVVAYTELLLIDTTLSSEQRRRCECALRAATDAAAVIKRLGQFHRGQDAPAENKRVHLKELVSQIPLLTRPKWRDEAQLHGCTINIRLDLEEVPPVRGSAAELRTVLTNLVFNAVDAMPNGGLITLRLFGQGECVVMEVIDTGIGMDAEQAARCFEPFYSTKTEKSGLGLSVCHGIVVQHGGQIEVAANAGAGSIVRVSLPIADVDQLSTIVTPVPQEQGTPLRCLYIEDDAVVRDAFATMFEAIGVNLNVAATGADGLKMAQTNHYDVVFTDLGMKDTDGADVLAGIKDQNPEVPVVIISGWPREEVDAWFTGNVKPDHILEKPATLKNIQRILAAIKAPTRSDESVKV